MFGSSVYHGPGKRHSIALTFDDGPSPRSVELLDYLDKEGVRATFFVCGKNVLRHVELAREMKVRQHEIGNHTFSHARLCPRIGWQPNVLSPAAVLREFAIAQEIITSEVGVEPRLLRVPYGLRWIGLGSVKRKLKLQSVLWSVIGNDWKWPCPQIVDEVLGKATPGGIICLHDGRDIRPNPDIRETIAAVRRIIPALKERGYCFETVSEILRA